MNKILIGVTVAIGLTVWWVGNTYNSMATFDQGVQAKWADVEAQYQRRMDTIPNLVEVVKGSANFEQKTLTDVIEARAKATQVVIDPSKLDANSIQKFQEAQGLVGSALGRLMAVAENYPALTSTAGFRDLQSQLEGTENRIAVARRDFNGAAQTYNTRIATFPGNIVAGVFSFEKKAYFKSDEGAAKAPQVKFQ